MYTNSISQKMHNFKFFHMLQKEYMITEREDILFVIIERVEKFIKIGSKKKW